MKKHAAPIIAALLLFLPVLYMGSYLALVLPGGRSVIVDRGPGRGAMTYLSHYRGWDNPDYPLALRRVFWPLEQIDRQVRPGAWGIYGPSDSN